MERTPTIFVPVWSDKQQQHFDHFLTLLQIMLLFGNKRDYVRSPSCNQVKNALKSFIPPILMTTETKETDSMIMRENNPTEPDLFCHTETKN